VRAKSIRDGRSEEVEGRYWGMGKRGGNEEREDWEWTRPSFGGNRHPDITPEISIRVVVLLCK